MQPRPMRETTAPCDPSFTFSMAGSSHAVGARARAFDLWQLRGFRRPASSLAGRRRMLAGPMEPAPAAPAAMAPPAPCTSYQRFVVFLLAFLQFTVILDFMILAPLGAILMPELHITTRQFGMVVSVYAFSAGVAGLLAAGFADRFDSKKLLLLFYCGFVLGTFQCGVDGSYHLRVFGRMVT